MTNEKEVLQKIFWPENKLNLWGNMIFSAISDDLKKSTEVAISRKKESLEIFYSTSEMEDPENKNYLVKIFYTRNDKELELNIEKTSPEIKSKEDINNVLSAIQNTILLINGKPNFFPTGVDETYAIDNNKKSVLK